MKKALRAVYNRTPRVVTTDSYRATEMAILEEKYYGDLNCTTQHRMCQYLNNIFEQDDHRFIKKKTNSILGIKSIETATKTISGIAIMHMIHKGQIEGIHSVCSEVRMINKVMSQVV